MIEKWLSASFMARLFQYAVSKDEQAAERLALLEGKSFSLKIDSVEKPWVFIICNGEIHASEEVICDVELSGSFFALLQSMNPLGKSHERKERLFITGDLNTARAVQDFIAQLKPDWEKVLCDHFGVRLGSLLTDILKETKKSGVYWYSDVSKRVDELMVGEKGLFTDRALFEQWRNDVDSLRRRLDALNIRLSTLERKLM